MKMSKISKLVGEGKEVKIGEITLDIRPLTVSSLPLLMTMGDEENKEAQANAMQEIIKRTIKNAVPDATDAEIEDISVEHLAKIMEAVAEVNQLGKITENQDFLEKMKVKQNVKRVGTVGDKETKG